MKDYQLAAKNWGADIELRVGQNEAVIAEDFKAGKCDGISVTGMRGRQFNKFTGSRMQSELFRTLSWLLRLCKA